MRARNVKCAIGAAAVAAMTLAACGGGGDATGDAGGDATGDTGKNPVSLTFGHIWDPAHPFQRCGSEAIAAILAEGDSGLELKSYPNEQLGTMAELVESMATGNVDMSVIGASYLAERYQPTNVFDAAYTFDDYDHAIEVMNGEIGERIYEGLREEAGLRTLDSWLYGARHVTADKPIKSPSDLEGLKFRVPDSPLMITNAKAIGATPVPMAFGEVYLALSQGTIDGQENPLSVIDTSKFHEVQDYVSLTGHMIQVSPVLISEKTWNKLSAEQQTALEEAVNEVTPQVNDCIRESEEKILEDWEETGAIEIVHPEEIDLEAFREQASEMIMAEYGDQWGDLYQEIRSGAAE